MAKKQLLKEFILAYGSRRDLTMARKIEQQVTKVGKLLITFHQVGS